VKLADAEAPSGPLGEVYRAAAVVRAAGRAAPEAVDRLARVLAAARPPEPDPYLDLAQGQLSLQRFAAAEATLREILARGPEEGSPEHLLVLEWLALARAGQGAADEAIGLLRQVLAREGGRVEAEYNLGRLLAGRNRPDEAAEHLERAVAGRPNQVLAWFHLGEVNAARDRLGPAADCYRRALAIDPGHTASYLSLGKTLLRQGDRAEALRYLRHGVKAAARPEQVAIVLEEALRGEPPARP
jgi:tetratricopeptide (TPR) repeat protein